jgi:hypothetical protein
MGNKELTSPRQKSDRQLIDVSNDIQWLCGTCGIANPADAMKCKVCQTDAPPQILSPSMPSKRGTFFKSRSKKGVGGNDGSPRNSDLSSPKPETKKLDSNEQPTLGHKLKSEPKMPALRRIKTLIVSKEENHALVFIKPTVPKHDLIREHIEEHFNSFKCYLTSEGTLSADEIAEKGIIDKHYAALARSAMDLNPPKRTVSDKVKEDFNKSFGIPYDDDKIITLGQLMKLNPELSAQELDQAWNAAKRVKLAGGVYVGRLETLETNPKVAPTHRPLLVVNGFYAAMRHDYVAKGNQVLYFTVEWKERDLSWKDFRALAVGATDPTKADPGSLRGKMLKHWRELGLKEPPSIQNNCVHASAGPIEAMRERATWIEVPLENDPFAQAMLNEGVPLELIKSWSENGIVTVDDKTGPAFDIFEDMDSGRVIRMAIRACIGAGFSPRDSPNYGRKKPTDSVVSEAGVVDVSSSESSHLRKKPAESVISEGSEGKDD